MKDCGTYYLFDTRQGSQDWLNMRKGRITMSNIGKIVGHAPYCKQRPEEIAAIIKGEKKETFSDEARERMRKGNEYEPIVRNYLEKYLGKKIRETGFAVWKQDERFGASLDGIIDDDTGIEIKCPAKMYKPLLEDVDKKSTKHIWRSQYDQIIGNGVITGRKNMVFCVYGIEDKKMFVQNVKVDYDYWNRVLYPKACQFYDAYMVD